MRRADHTLDDRRSTHPSATDPAHEEVPVERPNFGLSGKLAAETNTVNGVVLKYVEPAEARKPTQPWRLYVFKGDEQTGVLHIHRQSAYLIGRDKLVCCYAHASSETFVTYTRWLISLSSILPALVSTLSCSSVKFQTPTVPILNSSSKFLALISGEH